MIEIIKENEGGQRLHTARLFKLDKECGFKSADEFSLMNFDNDVASTITSRYYKGLSANGDNLVIVEKND